MPAGQAAPSPAVLAGSLPSEAGLEVNILRYLAACIEERRRLPEGGVAITLPTQREERRLGFDAATDLSPGRYAVLQFKRPCKPKGGAASFKLQTDQFCTLLRYPPASAFYVLPVVKTNRDMWDVRAGLLDRACLVDAWDLVVPLLVGGTGPRGGGSLIANIHNLKQQIAGGTVPQGDDNPFGRGRTIRISGCRPCTASALVRTSGAAAGATRRGMHGANALPDHVCTKPMRALCTGPPWAGFDVAGGGGRIMTQGGVKWSRDEAARLLGQALNDLRLPPREPDMRGRPDDRDDSYMWVEWILDSIERSGHVAGRGSRHLLKIGDVP